MEEEVKFCENCKRDISTKNYVIHTVHCERKIQLCHRCREPVPRSELEKHEEEFHSKDACSECGILVEKWQTEKHKEICVKKLIQCEFCELEVPLDILSDHSAACGSRTEHCSKCNKHVMIKDLGKHPSNCLRKESEAVPCEHCGFQIDWNEMMHHTVTCGTRTERCFLCDEHVMVKDRDAHFITCGKALNFNESISCDYCGDSFSHSMIGKHVELCRQRGVKCLICNDYIKIKDMGLHHTICEQKRPERLEFPCQYCRKLYPSDLIENHTSICGYKLRKCEKCDKNIPSKDLETHSNVCEHKRQVPCQYCGELYPSVFLKDHINICRSKPQECEKCGKNILLKDFETHSNMCGDKKQSRRKGSSPCKYCGKFFPDSLLEDHADLCRVRNKKCDKHIPSENMKMHLNACKEKKQLRLELPCQYCGELLHSDFLHDHADKCGKQEKKCEKCNRYIALKNMKTHSNECKEKENSSNLKRRTISSPKESCDFKWIFVLKGKNMSKTHGNCPICHHSIPWLEMTIHSAYCAQINSETDEYEYQNQLNELALNKESKASRIEISTEKKSQFDEDRKRCAFCLEIFPFCSFSQHLEVCEERPFNCDGCSKAMPYRKREEHEHSCLGLRKQTHADDYMLPDEETIDNKKVRKFKKCQFCDKRLPDVLFQHHLNECEDREEECTHCLVNVPVKDMQNHKLFKCNFTPLVENKNLNNCNKTYAEAIPGPSENFKRVKRLEEDVEICPSCYCKIPEERYHAHLLLCYNKQTQCHFCGIEIPKKNEHLHFQSCNKIQEIVEEDKTSQSKKQKEKTSKGKSFTQVLTSWIPSYKSKSFERNTRQVSKESSTWQSNRGRSFEKDNMTPVHPLTSGPSEINELPCEFCNQMWPAEFLIEHESGCRPDLVSFPKSNERNEDDQKFAIAAATTYNHAPILGASPRSTGEEDNEWKVVPTKSNKPSIRESNDCRKKENTSQKQLNPKEKFFYYPSQDTDEVLKNQPSSFRKKRYSQVKESQETSKTNPDKEFGVKKKDSEKDEFTSFKFSASRFNEESQNASHPKKVNDDALSTDLKNNNETKSLYDHQGLPTNSRPILDYPKSYFNKEIKAVGAERTEKKRIMNSREDVDADLSLVNKDLEKMSLQKPITNDEENKSEPSACFETTESRTFNLNMPGIWNTECSLNSDINLRSHLLKYFTNNSENEAKDDILSNSAENVDHRSDYDAKNNETFGSSFVKSININQKEKDANDTKSETSNSDDIFYDADDGGAKYFDNFHESDTNEEKITNYNFNTLNFSGRNQKVNVDPSSSGNLKAAFRLEEENLNQKDFDLDGYFQFLHGSLNQSNEAVHRMLDEVEKLSDRTAGDCKCGNKECCCELLSSVQKTSLQACSFKDGSYNKKCSESTITETLAAVAKSSKQMKSKKSVEFSSKKKLEDENNDNDEALKWRKWRAPEKKLVFSSDSE